MSDPGGSSPLRDAAASDLAGAAAARDHEPDVERLRRRVLELLRRHTGEDFSAEDPQRLRRHIAARQRLTAAASPQEYLERLRASAAEAEQLADDLSARNAELFGDSDFVDLLEQTALPQVLAGKGAEASLRVWYAGCGTGEEAYTLAVLILEQLERRGTRPTLQLFASERHAASLHRARQGRYPARALSRVSEARLERFFVPENGEYRASQALRNAIVFAHHNLLTDPPFARQNLIVCRHRLRQLRAGVQPEVLALFHHALAPSGWLMLHPSDPGRDSGFFNAERAHPALLRKNPSIQVLPRLPPFPARPGRRAQSRPTPPPLSDHAVLHGQLREACLASVLIGPDDNVLHSTAGAASYLQVPGGEQTTHLPALLPPPLRQALPPVLAQAREHGEPRVSAPVALTLAGRPRHVALYVTPVTRPGHPGHALVVFQELPSEPLPEVDLEEATPEELRMRLIAARWELDTVLKDFTQAHAALSKANQGLASANEELRFTLEQAQTAKEELRSSNEELLMIHQDNLARLADASQILDDWQNLLASTEIVTLFLDRELRAARFTPQAQERFNLRPADAGRPVTDLASPIGYTDLGADARWVLERGERREREIQSPDGAWHLARLLPYHTDSAEPEGVVVTLLDITERKHAEEVLRQAHRRKDQFLAMLGHELRNPLAALVNAVDALRLIGGSAQALRVSSIMERQTRQLARLVDDLLDVSRITRGKIVLRRERLDLCTLVRETAEGQTDWIRERGRQLRLDVCDGPLMADADPVRLTQVVINLLTNAVKFTHEGGSITLTLSRDGREAVLSVRDDGIGMEPELLARVFDLFVQGEPSGMSGSAGLGIGLTLVRTLTELHGGRVEAHSAGPSRGSELVARLPLAGHRGLAPGRAEEPTGLDPAQRLLVVDDNPDAAESLRTLLDLLGVEVEVAHDARTALRLFEHWRPSIVLADLNMPSMDGYELARRLREDYPSIPARLIAVSGWSQPEHRKASTEAGFDRHLSKPVTIQDLRAVLQA